MRKLFIALSAGICLLSSCSNNREENGLSHVNPDSKALKDKLVQANQMYARRESDEIDQYVLRHHWDMISTGTGLRYMITKHGDGKELAQAGQTARVTYRISLLDGTVCYTSDKDGPQNVLIGQDDTESGLHEGLQYLHVGDEATFILPSHLAAHLMGDGDKIPPQASVVYQIKLLSLK